MKKMIMETNGNRMHCIHCLKHTLRWVPSDFTHNLAFPTCSGCTTTTCALRNNGATKHPANCEAFSTDKCMKLSYQDVVLLSKLQLSQSIEWRSDLAYESDFTIMGLRNRVRNALIMLEGKSVEKTSGPTSNESTVGDKGETGSSLDIENLRVKIDISNSLRGIFQIQHRRQAYREAAAGNPSALAHIDADNFPPIPPLVGPSTLPRSIGLVDDEEPSDNSKTAGKKRAASDGSG
ncbi:hypothetical protein FNAPI_6748 [Fusarium napiforme]|uniref:Uncharacterized protein n=1 Tax=Fusarium napiforme TaxID=42672 RepID=A0A8H5JHZ5_9HYPO|nr:hypothetical protein FNAPI_6748 [Fusarium napiforme]